MSATLGVVGFSLTWQAAISLSLLTSTGYSLVYRGFAKENPDKAFVSTPVMYLLTLMPVSVVHTIFSDDVSINFPAQTWGLLILMGSFFALANLAAFWANTKVDAAQFSILSNSRTFVTIFLSSLFLQESLSRVQFLGVVLITVATVLVVSANSSWKIMQLDRYSLVALLSALFLGSSISLEKYLLDDIGFDTYVFVGWSMQALMMVLFALPHRSRVRDLLQGKPLKQLLVLGCFRTVGGFGFVYALETSGNSSLIISVASFRTSLVVLGSYFLLKERDHIGVKLAGTVIATAGLSLLV